MVNYLILTLAIAQAPDPKGDRPEGHLSDAVRWAVRDIQTVPPDLRYRMRYLTIYNWSESYREPFWKVINGHLHHLSPNKSGRIPWRDFYIVPETNSSLARIDLFRYGIDPEIYGQLTNNDPHFHIHEEIDNKGKIEVQTKLAPWLVGNAKDAAGLAFLNEQIQSQLGSALFRADWFLNQTASQFQRSPGYYDFIGVKDKKGFEKVAGYDEKISKIKRREALALSGVTKEARAFEFQQTAHGEYFYSIDFLLAIKEKNPLVIIGEDIEKVADAFETYAHLPNGFWMTGAFNGKGVRQDFAPGEIAGNNVSTSNDKLIHVNISCLQCHTKAGVKDISGFFRGQLNRGVKFSFFDPGEKDYHKAREKAEKISLDFEDEYRQEIQTMFDRSRLRFEIAVKEVTGWDAETYANKYVFFWSNYENWQFGHKDWAIELGTTPELLTKALRHQLNRHDEKGNKIGFLIRELLPLFPDENDNFDQTVKIGVRQWEEVFPEAQKLLFGFQDLKISKRRIIR